MIFSIGDLITFVVVLLILVVYRALDRNNRSLEKLKRFSDKITENLAALVEQRTAQVRDLSLELQSSLKTGKEMITRAQGVEELLKGKAEDIQEIQHRFTEYDKALAELTAMSARVDKNLLRLRDESDFVGKVGRRISESAQRLQLVEKQIPELQQGFAARTHEQLEAARSQVMASVHEQASALITRLAESEKKAKEFVERTREDLDAARGGVMASIDARVSALSVQFAESEKKVKNLAVHTLDDLEAARGAAVASVDQKASAVTGQIASSEKQVKDFAVQTLVELQSARAEAVAAVEGKRTFLADQLSESEEKVALLVTRAREQLVTAQDTALASVDEKVSAVTSQFAESEKKVSDSTVHALVELESARAEVVAIVEEKRSVLADQLSESEEKVEELTAHAREELDAARNTMMASVAEKASALSVQLAESEKKSKEFAARAREEMDVARSEVLAAVDEKAAALSTRLADSESKVKDFSTYIARLETRLEQTEKEKLEELGKALDAFDVELRGKMSGAARRGETLEDEVFARLSSRIQEDEAAIAKSIQVIENRLADYQGDVEYRVKGLEESSKDVDALRASLSQSMEKIAAGVRTEMKSMGAELMAGWTAEIAGATVAREQLRAGIAELESGLTALKSQAYQDVEKKLSVFEDEFLVDLRARSTVMQEKLQAWQSEIETRAAAFETDVRERIGAADGSIQNLRETIRLEMEKVKKDASLTFEKDLTGVRDTMEAGNAEDAPRDRDAPQGAFRGARRRALGDCRNLRGRPGRCEGLGGPVAAAACRSGAGNRGKDIRAFRRSLLVNQCHPRRVCRPAGRYPGDHQRRPLGAARGALGNGVAHGCLRDWVAGAHRCRGPVHAGTGPVDSAPDGTGEERRLSRVREGACRSAGSHRCGNPEDPAGDRGSDQGDRGRAKGDRGSPPGLPGRGRGVGGAGAAAARRHGAGHLRADCRPVRGGLFDHRGDP